MVTVAKRHESRRMTPRQMEVLTFIRDYRARVGYSPTLQEIADELGITKVTVFEHVGALVEKGLLRHLAHKARSLEITPRAQFPDSRPTCLPLIGRIAAGLPVEAIENPEFLDLEALFTKRGQTFVLRVDGDSMIDDGIRPGDYVVVERRTVARNGETVVALVDGEEATLKKYYKEGRRVKLVAANKAYPPIRPDRVEVQGVVVGLIRQY